MGDTMTKTASEIATNAIARAIVSNVKVPRERVAYNVFRNGFSENAPPVWDDLESWMRDALTVAYLQGTLDGRR
jgi:hypothetical protein